MDPENIYIYKTGVPSLNLSFHGFQAGPSSQTELPKNLALVYVLVTRLTFLGFATCRGFNMSV